MCVCVSCANRARVTLSNAIELSSRIEYLRRILMLVSVPSRFAIDRRIFPVLTTTVFPCLAPGVLYHSQLFLSVFEYRQPKINCTISFWELFDLCSFCTLSIFCPDVGLYFYAFRAASWWHFPSASPTHRRLRSEEAVTLAGKSNLRRREDYGEDDNDGDD